MPAASPDSDYLVAFARSLALVLTAATAYWVYWLLASPGSYLTLILATYAALAGLLLLQVVRTAAMATWRRRIAAVLTVPAAAGTIFAGLQPRPNCLDTLGCGRGLNFTPEWFVPFVAATAVLVTVDRRLD